MIDFSGKQNNGSIFGAPKNGQREDQPKAKVWLNIGYIMQTEVLEEGKDARIEDTFISIPVGIPLDTMEPKAIVGNSENFRALTGAQNNLLEMLQKAAESLKPGDEEIVNLQIQMRRVKEPVAAPATGDNPFIPEGITLFAPKTA